MKIKEKEIEEKYHRDKEDNVKKNYKKKKIK